MQLFNACLTTIFTSEISVSSFSGQANRNCVSTIGSTATLGYSGIFPAIVDGDSLLHLLLHGGDQGTIPGSQGPKKAELEVSYQVYDVVPAPRGTQDYQRGVRTGI